MCRKVWGFESLRGHQKAFPGYPAQNAASFEKGLRRFSFPDSVLSSPHMKPPSLIIGCLLAAICAGALAKPAPWFQWRSKADGSLACSQTPLGHGWERAAGPYRDARCEKRIVAK